jgi:branched-subunit amino acid transport protein
VTTVWAVVALTGIGTIALKATGPVLLGGRPLSPKVASVVELLGPALLAALVAINTFGEGRSLVVDARVAGVAAGALAIRLRAPVLIVLVVAAGTTAAVRAIGWLP